eukprot:2275933-Amphidinium_carterae.1
MGLDIGGGLLTCNAGGNRRLAIGRSGVCGPVCHIVVHYGISNVKRLWLEFQHADGLRPHGVRADEKTTC